MALRCAGLLSVSLLLGGCSLPDSPDEAKTPIALPIGKVQGSEALSPYDGQAVILQGVVTGNFVSGLDGFFMQDAMGESDNDPDTSDGIFVIWTQGSLPKVRRGDRVRVSGEIREIKRGQDSFQTTLQASAVEVLGRGAVAATPIDAAPASLHDWERYEGMWLRITTALTLSGNDGLLRFGELTAVFGPRQFTPTELHRPGRKAQALEQEQLRQRLVLDDNSNAEYPEQLWFLPEPLSPQAPLRVDSILHGVEGILHNAMGWRLQLTEPIERIEQAARPPAPELPELPGGVRIASFNLFNWFNGDGNGRGFPTSRGAESLSEAMRQRDKLVAAIVALKPDVVALMEVENDGYGPDSSLAQLLAALAAAWPEGEYRLIDAEGLSGEDEIRVAMIYRTTRLQAVGQPITQYTDAFASHNRKPLLQTFRVGPDGALFNLVANHFKSKGCNEAHGDDQNQNDGQACWNQTRTQAAKALDAWLKTDPNNSGSSDTLIIGDLNSYAREDPLRALQAAGWKDAFELAGVKRPYSYNYRGYSGRLDHALLSGSLAPRLRAAVEWHINADESEAFDYRRRNRDKSWYVPDPYRSSDHDPLILLLDFTKR